MKIKIEYKPSGDARYPCQAQARIDGNTLVAIEPSWEEAKNLVIAKVKSQLSIGQIPSPEEIEL